MRIGFGPRKIRRQILLMKRLSLLASASHSILSACFGQTHSNSFGYFCVCSLVTAAILASDSNEQLQTIGHQCLTCRRNKVRILDRSGSHELDSLDVRGLRDLLPESVVPADRAEGIHVRRNFIARSAPA